MLRDGRRDEPALEAEAPDPLRADAHRPEPGAWDAWDGARRDAGGAADLRRALADEDAEKLAGRARGVRVQDAWFPRVLQLVLSEQPGAGAELCRPDEALSAARSCAARVVAAERLQRVAPPDAAGPGLAARR